MLIRLELYFYYCLGLPTGQDSATYWNKGTEVSSLSRDKGTMGQAKNLTKGQDRPGQPKFGPGRDSQNLGRDGTAKIRDGTQDKTGLSRKGCSKTGRRCSKTENDVLKQEKDVLKQEKDVLKQEKEVLKQKIWSFYWKFFNSFCPGTSRDRGFCPGTFAPAFVLGQWDTGTRNFFCPGTSHGNPTIVLYERSTVR